MANSPRSALSELTDVLTRLAVPHAIGGSVASASCGVFRSTLDVDMVVHLGSASVGALAASLGRNWYADPDYIRESLRAGRSFNLVHMPTVGKFDLFPAISEFHARQLERARPKDVEYFGDIVNCPVVSPEDILLAKLRWYRDGGEVSERQWSDIHGILAINANLDFNYINHWAASLGVSDLLARALYQQGG